MKLKRDALLLKLGSAQHQWPAAWRLVSVRVPKARQPVNRKTFGFALRKDKLREVRGGKGGIYYEATSARRIRRRCGTSMCN